MTKTELRQYYKAERQKFSPIEIQDRSEQLLLNLIQMPIWDRASYHIFVPIKSQNEINTWPIIDYLFSLGKQVSVPIVQGKELTHAQITAETQWQKAAFGIEEPKEYETVDDRLIEVVFVPLLVCDRKGHRVGYGGGYYDRFLAKTHPDCLKIGLSFFEPIDEIPGIESTDIPLDYCITSAGIVSFTSGSGNKSVK